jgi:hypothetical protein
MTDKEDKRIHIPNLHPSQRPTTSYDGSNNQASYEDPDAELSSSFKERIESFVGSYSRASLMHMAENVVVNDGGGLVSSFYSCGSEKKKDFSVQLFYFPCFKNIIDR